MAQAIEVGLELLWRNALGVVPLALAVAAITRLVPTRPSTRHALWVAALVGFLAPPLLPGMDRFGPPTAAEVAQRAAAPSRDQAPPARAATPAHDVAAASTSEPTAQAEPEPELIARVLTTPRIGEAQAQTSARSMFERPVDRGLTVSRAPSQTRQSPEETPITPALRTAAPADGNRSAALAHDLRERADAMPGRTGAATGDQPAGIAGDWAMDWQVTLLALREALVSMPHIPAHVWLLGAGVALAIGCGRAMWFRRLLSNGDGAPAEIEQMVAGASARLGLRRTPRTVLVDDRITPMVWCGRRARLVLPRSLWDELDEVGRASVVHHELAHLKRKDHWICWVEALVGLLYWWHPVAWWVRRRIREEADLCCDAWVTALLPQHRRAYAQALVSTRQYISEHGSVAPAVGLGVMSNRGRRFARRLLMIMTNSHKPSLSTMGRALALGVACAGVLASPVLACPPDEKKEKAEAKQAESTAPDAVESEDDRSTFEQFMEERDGEDSGPDAVRAQTLETLHARLAEQRAAAEADGDICASEEAKIAAISKEIVRISEPVRAQPVDAARVQPAGAALAYVQHSDEGASTFEQWAQGETFERTYTLSDPEKLERLTALLVRDDVPLLVRPQEDAITVIGTRAQHERFATFISLIDGESDVQRVYDLPEGRLDALTELMALSTVPVLVRPEDEGLRVWGSELDHDVFAGFMTLLGAEGDARVIINEQRQRDQAEEEEDDDCSKGRAEVIAQREAQRQARDEMRRQHEAQREAQRRMQEIRREAEREMREVQRQHSRTMHEAARHEQKAHEIEARSAQIEHQSESMEAHAEQLEEQAEAINDQADDIEEHADEVEESGAEEAASDDIREHANQLREQAEAFLEEAEQIREKAERLRDKADELRDEADELRDRADEVREEADELEDRLHEIEEDREEAVAQLREEHASSR